MCGIFGFISAPGSDFDTKKFRSLINNMFILSESRGKDASGLLLLNNLDITILKRPLRAKYLIRSQEYRILINQFGVQGRHAAETLGFMGHARMVTNGSEDTHDNNQPVIKHDMCLLHNGIVVNDTALWKKFPDMERAYEVDTEVVLSLIQHYREKNQPIIEAFSNAIAQLEGANSFAFLSIDSDVLVLATTNGSLYLSVSPNGNELVFSSERFILNKALTHPSIKTFFINSPIVHLEPGVCSLFSLKNLTSQNLFTRGKIPVDEIQRYGWDISKSITDIRPSYESKAHGQPRLLSKRLDENEKFIKQVNDSVNSLKRCIKCVLPETFPNIKFDEDGVCNFCHNYALLNFQGHAALENVVNKYRRFDGRPDCLVPISGGRDSCFALHYLKNELQMNPVAYTYDWGMVTDLARRNISRMCGALGVEHILISADIKTKRKYVRQNVLAWLKHPVLGTVPLFMAGDKQFFYYAQMLKRQMEIDLAVFGFNRLERTDFKAIFANADESKNKINIHEMSSTNKFRLIAYYAGEYLRNPAYINSSVMDTIFAYFSFYMIPKSFEPLFDYIRWDEKTVNNTLIKEYDWEIAKDTDSTWRIGDGTASFYNYIYYVMAGFSENDTFKSNQIREGMLSRMEALESVNQDNQPRYEAIQWYCEAIGIDMQAALKVINAAPKLYSIEALSARTNRFK